MQRCQITLKMLLTSGLGASQQVHKHADHACAGCPPEACSPVAASGLSGGSSLSGIKVTHQQVRQPAQQLSGDLGSTC